MLLNSLLQRRHALTVLNSFTSIIRSYVSIPGRTFQSQVARPERFRILFMGRDQFSCLVLKELHQAKDVWKEIVIATQPDAHVGRSGSILSISPLKTFGQELDIPVHTIPKSKGDFKNWPLPEPFAVHETSEVPLLNHLLVTASFGRILPTKMLNSFQPSRRLNVHPSLLPAYRGPAPIQHTIINNETNTGVCVIEMLKKSEGIDAGSLWGCQEMAVPINATYGQLRDQLGIRGGQLLVSVLRDAIREKAVARIQTSADHAPHAPFITAKDCLVDFYSMTAEDIRRRFRALNHQKPLFTYTSNGKILQLRELGVPIPSTDIDLSLEPGSTTYHKPSKMLLIRCKDSTILGVMTIKPEGKGDRPASEFWQGLREIKAGDKEINLGKAVSVNNIHRRVLAGPSQEIPFRSNVETDAPH